MKSLLLVAISLAPLACGCADPAPASPAPASPAQAPAAPPVVVDLTPPPAPPPTAAPKAEPPAPEPAAQADPVDPHLARQAALREAAEFGRIGLLSSAGSDPSESESHGSSAPKVRQGDVGVNGRLPPEVIQRIVRQNFGRFRLCYENGLRDNPKLQGKVTIKFVIEKDGSIGTVSDGGSDLPNPGVVQCVVRGARNLSFPAPEGGKVTVVYPIVFSPADPPKPAAPPPPAKKP